MIITAGIEMLQSRIDLSINNSTNIPSANSEAASVEADAKTMTAVEPIFPHQNSSDIKPASPEPNPVRAYCLKEIERYETLRTIARVMKTVGLVLMIIGVGVAAVYFGAPVLAVVVGTVLIAVPAFIYGSIVEPRLFTFTAAKEWFHFTAHVLWHMTVDTLYNPAIAIPVGIACGVVTAVGGILYVAGALGERHCDRKLIDWHAAIVTERLQSKLGEALRERSLRLAGGNSDQAISEGTTGLQSSSS